MLRVRIRLASTRRIRRDFALALAAAAALVAASVVALAAVSVAAFAAAFATISVADFAITAADFAITAAAFATIDAVNPVVLSFLRDRGGLRRSVRPCFALAAGAFLIIFRHDMRDE
jgi:hypothetical protein